MILCVNIGNAIISFGVFDLHGQMVVSFDIASDFRKTPDEYVAIIKSICSVKNIEINNVEGAIISSVVPSFTRTIETAVSDFANIKAMVVGPGIKTGFHINIDNPSELGADMVSNTAAALQMRKSGEAIIVADLGMINTISAINVNGEYVGCSIFPGVQLSFDMLHAGTALIPSINSGELSKAIGKNSQSSVRSGVLLGEAMAIDGFVEKFKKELNVWQDKLLLVATGNYAKVLLPCMKSQFSYDPYLTLKGLYIIYKHNSDSK